jgi:predicted nuclease of restriction endonuclease-like (RecB) superfamily
MKKLEKSYVHFLSDLKNEIKTARVKAALAVNRELVLLYFKIGKSILEKQKEEGWGSKIIERISRDLREEFPEMTGLSTTNLFYMRRFAEILLQIVEEFEGGLILQAPLGELQKHSLISSFFSVTWYHNIALMDQVSENKKRLWYASQTIENGWSRNVLIHQIKSDLYRRQVSADKSHNFHLTLPKDESDLVSDLFKDEYNFDFLRGGNFSEKEIENHLTENIVKFLLELGKGFTFAGKQYHLEVGGQDFYVDLLFYNFELRRFIVIELKAGEFKPEYAGKLGFYLSVIDEKLKREHDRDSIGIILCTKNNKEISKHSTRYMMKPVGVSEYKIAEKILDKELKKILPSAEELEKI